jgi:hypothetical protein
MIWGYYDESGEYDAGGKLLNMTIGACFAPLERWQSFDAEWLKALEDEGLTYFHMTDFEAWKPPFDFKVSDGSRDKAKHNRLLNSLLEIMLRHIDGLYGFGAVSMFDPDMPPQTHKNLMEDCIGGAIPLNLVFGKQRHFPEGGIKKYADIYDWGEAKGRINCLSMAEPMFHGRSKR